MTHTVEQGLGISEIIGDKRDAVLRLAAEHGAYNVRVFGSVARGEAEPDSDIDFLMDGLEHAPWGGGSLLVALEKLLGRQVDLVSMGDIYPSLRERILAEAQLL